MRALVFPAAALCMLVSARAEEKPAAGFLMSPALRAEDFTPADKARSAEVLAIAEDAIRAFQRDDLAKARELFRKILGIDPENVIALVNLGSIESRLEQFEAAEANLEKAVRIEPKTAPGWLALGALRYGRGDLDGALAALSQAAFLDPKNPRVHGYLGVTIGSKGWYLGAEQELRRAIELDPNYAEAHFNLSLFYLRRSPPSLELARRHYQRARDLGAAPDPLVEKQLGQ